jgi:hypothetical protein
MAYRPSPELVPGVATVVGKEVHVPRGAMLPEVCLKCGTTGKLRTGPREVVWVPAVLVFGWFLMPVVALIALAMLRKKSEIVYSLCRPCERRRIDAMTSSRMIVLGAIITFLAFLTAIFNEAPVTGVLIAFAGGGLGLFAWKRLVIGRTLDVAWIHSDGTVALKGVHSLAAKAASEHQIKRRK